MEKETYCTHAGCTVYRERVFKQWTQGDLARRAGVSVRTICYGERGLRRWSDDTRRRVALALGIDLGGCSDGGH